jgi:hypothetical protein
VTEEQTAQRAAGFTPAGPGETLVNVEAAIPANVPRERFVNRSRLAAS